MNIASLLVAVMMQSPASAPDSALLAAARTASTQFHDRSAAVRAGFRKLGPEIPEMGEHWINPILIVEARYDADAPAVLTYATIAGKPTLTGVAYALAVNPGEQPPPTNVSGGWHDHFATVHMELTGPHRGSAPGARVVVMHAWVWLDNPDGPFSDANWALPFVRAGLAPPTRVDPNSARAVSLLFVEGPGYYRAVLRPFVAVDAAVFEAARQEVAGIVGTQRTISDATSQLLAAAWLRLVDGITRDHAAHAAAVRSALLPHH